MRVFMCITNNDAQTHTRGGIPTPQTAVAAAAAAAGRQAETKRQTTNDATTHPLLPQHVAQLDGQRLVFGVVQLPDVHARGVRLSLLVMVGGYLVVISVGRLIGWLID